MVAMVEQVVIDAGRVTGGDMPMERLEHEICELSAQLAASTCRWLMLVGEFDRRKGW